jgi:hypothetical protein
MARRFRLAAQTDVPKGADGHAGKAGMALNGIASDALAARPDGGADKRRLGPPERGVEQRRDAADRGDGREDGEHHERHRVAIVATPLKQ